MFIPGLQYLIPNCGTVWDVLIFEFFTEQEKNSSQLWIFNDIQRLYEYINIGDHWAKQSTYLIIGDYKFHDSIYKSLMCVLLSDILSTGSIRVAFMTLASTKIVNSSLAAFGCDLYAKFVACRDPRISVVITKMVAKVS